jgi:hypothetical protein
VPYSQGLVDIRLNARREIARFWPGSQYFRYSPSGRER